MNLISSNICKYLFLFIFFCYAPTSTHAQEISYAGTIDGKIPLHMFFDASGNKVRALYFYDRIGMPIVLEGGIGSGKFVISNDAEQFTGMIHDKNVTGTWNDKKRKRSLPFVLAPIDAGFAELSGRYKCKARRSGAGGSAEVPLSMEIKSGKVTRFDIESLLMPYAHSCNPDHSKLKQTVKGNRLLIESTADPDQRCPMSLRRAGAFILLQNEGGACLCGARASIPDVLLNTQNNTCTIAQ